MSHEITANDNIVLHLNAAWHGLGIIVKDAPTPKDALTIAGLDWGVQSRPLYVKDDHGNEIEVPSHVANYRADTGDLLSVVRESYKVVSNADMADFCEALLEDGIVTCESAGSIRGGKRVWFLLKGEAFGVANDDEIFPYILVSNGHDSLTSFRVTPTTVRVVCSNTLHAVLPRTDTGELMDSAFCIRHTTNVMERVAEAREALQHYSKAINETKTIAETLAGKQVTSDEMKQFFMDCYQRDFKEVPANPTNKVEENRRVRCMDAFASFTRRFDDEKHLAGTTLWNALNAYTGLIQHDRKARGADDEERVSKRIDQNLFGLNQNRTQAALATAWKMMQTG